MRVAATLHVLVLLTPALAAAQTAPIEGYLVGGPAFYSYRSSTNLLVTGGAGAEYRPTDLLGVAGEASLFAGEGLFEAISLDATLRLRKTSGTTKWHPYAALGPTFLGVLINDGGTSQAGWRVRVGLKYWMAERSGWMLEFVELAMARSGETRYLPMIRAGLVFR